MPCPFATNAEAFPSIAPDRSRTSVSDGSVRDLPMNDGQSMAILRAKREAEGSIFRVSKGVAVLDPERAQTINAENFADTTLPDRFVDLLRRRRSPTISWREIRSAWAPVLQQLARPDAVAALEGRLRDEIEQRLDQPLDLTRAVQEIFTRALIPVVMDDLPRADVQRVVHDQDAKLERLLRTEQRDDSTLETLRSAVVQFRCGRVARRVIRGRAKGRRPRRVDLADPLVDLLPRLGMDRAAFAVTMVLTAIAGPPGAVATCLLLELARRDGWRSRLADEQAEVDAETYRAGAARAAPATNRFVKETLRLWSAPLVLTRLAQEPMRAGDEQIETGDLFHLSPHFVNRDPESWPDPHAFDPDRWLSGSGRGPARSCAYVPFGWSPTSCIGAGLGQIELMLLARLFTTEFALEAESPEDVEVVMASVPLPAGFRGRIVRR